MKDRSELLDFSMRRRDFCQVEWKTTSTLVAYEDAVDLMEQRVAAIHAGEASELVWLVEHPPIYTAGTSTNDADLLSTRFPVHRTGRGGQFTYHGPGQRVAYVMLDLNARTPDLRRFVASLEAWIIETLAHFSVSGERREDRVGVGGLGEIVEGAQPRRFDRCGDRAVARQHHHARAFPRVFQVLEQREARGPLEAQIDHRVLGRLAGLQRGDRGLD